MPSTFADVLAAFKKRSGCDFVTRPDGLYKATEVGALLSLHTREVAPLLRRVFRGERRRKTRDFDTRGRYYNAREIAQVYDIVRGDGREEAS